MSETVNWEKAYRVQTERVAELRRENAALREDKARLDYLLEKCSSFVLEDFTTGNRDLYHIDATRAAIDDARAKEGQP